MFLRVKGIAKLNIYILMSNFVRTSQGDFQFKHFGRFQLCTFFTSFTEEGS